MVYLDLEKFFDRGNHDKLMAAVARRVADKRMLKLIRVLVLRLCCHLFYGYAATRSRPILELSCQGFYFYAATLSAIMLPPDE